MTLEEISYKVVSLLFLVIGILLVINGNKVAQAAYQNSKGLSDSAHNFFSNLKLGFLFPQYNKSQIKYRKVGFIFIGVIFIIVALANLSS